MLLAGLQNFAHRVGNNGRHVVAQASNVSFDSGNVSFDSANVALDFAKSFRGFLTKAGQVTGNSA
jgi:hypothetical protein